MTNKLTQTPDPQDSNSLQWLAPKHDDATIAPKDEADKDDDDVDDEEDDDEFDEDEDEDAEEKEEGDETA